jgi:hypothetical protein
VRLVAASWAIPTLGAGLLGQRIFGLHTVPCVPRAELVVLSAASYLASLPFLRCQGSSQRGRREGSAVSMPVPPVAISPGLRHAFAWNTRAHIESTCIPLTQHRCALFIAQLQGLTADSSVSFAYEMCSSAHTFWGQCRCHERQGIVRKCPLLCCVGLPATSWWPCSYPPLLFVLEVLVWVLHFRSQRCYGVPAKSPVLSKVQLHALSVTVSYS